MIKYSAIMPFAYKPYADECLMTTKLDILAKDNTEVNIGVAASWNKGIDRMYAIQADWLIIISATMRFGKAGGLDILDQLESHSEADIVHFAAQDVPEQAFVRGKTLGVNDGVFGWWCTAINRRVIDRVGKFDKHFYPVYFEDVDYDWRVNRDMPEAKWLVLPIDAKSMGIGHGVKLGGVIAPAEPNLKHFREKWGREPQGAYNA